MLRKFAVLAVLGILALTMAVPAFAAEEGAGWTPALANVIYQTVNPEYAAKLVVVNWSKVPVDFWCDDEETAKQFQYDSFTLYLPLALNMDTGEAYAVLPRTIGGRAKEGLGPEVYVGYRLPSGAVVSMDKLLVPLVDVAKDKYVYVKCMKNFGNHELESEQIN